jgi:hypothetical protein
VSLDALGLAGNSVLLARVAGLAEEVAMRRVEGDAEKVRRFCEFRYAAKTWGTERRVIARVEASDRGTDSRFVVTNLAGAPRWLYEAVYCARGRAEQWIKEGKLALRWTRLSCRTFRDNAVRLQLFALAYNLANFLRSLVLPTRWRSGRSRPCARSGQDRRPDRAPRALRGFPAGRGGGPRAPVRRDLAPDRPLAGTACGDSLTGADHGATSVEG